MANSITVFHVSDSNKRGRNAGRGDDGCVCGRGRGRGDDGRGDGCGRGRGDGGRGDGSRGGKIATALAKAAESATDNLMEVKVKNVKIKHGQFIKDYNNGEDYSSVKEIMVRYLC